MVGTSLGGSVAVLALHHDLPPWKVTALGGLAALGGTLTTAAIEYAAQRVCRCPVHLSP
jgi:hypothetical protein